MSAADDPNALLASRAETVLRDALAHEKAFVKVHAAEALVALGDRAEPHCVFAAELPAANEQRPYRIGVWRVLALSSATTEERRSWIEKVESVATDSSALDQLHAIETVGKLGHAARPDVLAAARKMTHGTDADAVFPRWVLYLGGDRAVLPLIVGALESKEPPARLRAAYVLAWLKIADPAARAAVARAAQREPRDSVGYTIVLGSALTLNPTDPHASEWVTALETIVASGAAGDRYQACMALMRRYRPADLARLAPLLDHVEGDVRIGAALAILHVARHGRIPSTGTR